MPESWVLKFLRADGENPVLLQASSSGGSALDINILATEGEAPYKGKIRQRKVADLRAKNYHGSDDEWQNILSNVFNPQSTALLPDDQLKGLEVVANQGNSKLTITLRKRIDKITQKLGSVELAQDDDAEIQLFEWCSSVIDHKSILEAEQSELRSRYQSAQSTIKLLEAKLEELVQAKADHEEQMISKFVLLLNEKKLKIRNQQRLLSTAKVDKKEVQQMHDALEAKGKGRQAESSRAGKRSADAQGGLDDEAQTESSDAFEDMELDKQERTVARSQKSDSERHTTPETDTATESDDAASEPASNGKEPAPIKDSKKKTTSRPLPKRRKSPQPRAKAASPLPPVRQLPFAKANAKARKDQRVESEAGAEKAQSLEAQSKSGADESGEETASDDDEL